MNRGCMRRHIAFLLALALIWNVFADNMVKVQAQGSIPGSQEGFQVRAFEINLVDGDNRTPITDESEVHAGQEVEVKFEWTLDNSVRVPDGEPWTPQTFYIDTNSGDFKYAGLNIPGMEAGTSTSPLPLYANGKEAPVGSYYMENGIIYIIIEDQEFFQNEDGRYGGVSFRGTIAASDDKKDDGKKKKIEFGNESANPTYFLTDTESSVSLNKTTNGGITAREGKLYQTFTVTVKAQNGTITGLDLQDSVYPEGKLTNATDVKVSASTAEEVPVQNFGSLAEALQP